MERSLHTRDTRSALWLDLVALLLGTLILGVAWYIPAAPLAFSHMYLRLYPLERSEIGSYAWSEPEFELHLPLELAAHAVLVRQRITAGATREAARPIQVRTATTTLSFVLQGGTPLRTYTYLLPATPSELAATFSIDPIAPDSSHDQRKLGALLTDTQVRLLASSRWPAPPLLALAGMPLILLLVLRGWGVGRWRPLVLLLLVLILTYFYRIDRYTVTSTITALAAGLLLVATLGYLCRQLARQAPDGVSSILIWSLAAVIGPWTYIAAGLWSHMGRLWIVRPTLTVALLGLPVVAALIAIWAPLPRRLRPALGGLALAGVLGWGLANLYLEMTYFAIDFSAYYDGMQRVFAGQPLYQLDVLRETPFFATYKYHPFFLIFVLPFALVPMDLAIILWRSLGAIMLIASIAIMIAAQPPVLRRRLILLAIIIGTNLAPLGQTIRLGQTDPLILFSIVLALVSYQRAGWLSAGLWGMLGLIKVYPLFLLIPALIQHAWRWLILIGLMLVLGSIVALGFGWENQQIYWRTVVPLLGERNGRMTNQSLYALVLRLVNPDIVRDPTGLINTPAVNLPFLGLAAAIFAGTGWLLWRRRSTASAWQSMSLLICTMLLIMPVSWDHYETLLLIPLLCGIAHTLGEPERPLLWLLAAYALLAFGIIKNLWHGVTEPTAYRMLFTSYRTLGLMLLWGWWAYLFAQGPQDNAHSPGREPASLR